LILATHEHREVDWCDSRKSKLPGETKPNLLRFIVGELICARDVALVAIGHCGAPIRGLDCNFGGAEFRKAVDELLNLPLSLRLQDIVGVEVYGIESWIRHVVHAKDHDRRLARTTGLSGPRACLCMRNARGSESYQ
jgi:hypothetical protein